MDVMSTFNISTSLILLYKYNISIVIIMNINVFIIIIIIILFKITEYYINIKNEYKQLLNRHMLKYKNSSIKIEKPPFPIDIVYTWAGPKDTTNIRQSDYNELKYSIRSVKMFLPWGNNIYIFMNPAKQEPEWMKEGVRKGNKIVIDNIIIYDHNDIFENDGDITNSNLIETYIPYLPGLSEHFIYFNDDIFILKKLEYTDFFTEDGKAYIINPTKKNNDMVKNNMQTDLTFKLPKYSGFYKHIPITMIKSQAIKYHKEYKDYINFVRNVKKRETLGCTICEQHNLRCPCQQQHYPIHFYMYENNKAVYKNYGNDAFIYTDMAFFSYISIISEDIFKSDSMFLCINNAYKPVNKKYTVKKFNQFGNKYWFIKPEHEK